MRWLMFNINDDLIADVCTNFATYANGKRYYERKKIKTLNYDEQRLIFKAVVTGARSYDIKVSFNPKGSLHEATCTCPAYHEYWGYCKHIVAVLIAIAEKDRKGEFSKIHSENKIKEILDFFLFKQTDIKTPVELEVNYELRPSNYNRDFHYSYLSLRIGKDKLYVVRDIRRLLQSLKTGEVITYGKSFTFDPEKHTFRDKDMHIIEFMQELADNEEAGIEDNNSYKKYSIFTNKNLLLTTNSLKRFLKINRDRTFNGIIYGKIYKDIEITEDDFPINFFVNATSISIPLAAHKKASLWHKNLPPNCSS